MTDTFATNTAEKIETIVMCYLQNGTTSGTMGTLVDVPAFENDAGFVPRCYRVETDGKTFIVRTTVAGWEVMFGPYVADESDLYDAAALVASEQVGGSASPLAALGWTFKN